MGSLQKLEAQLDVWLNKKAPVKIPADGRKSLAGALWWIALVVGIFQLWGAWILWHAGHLLEEGIRTYNSYVPDLYGAPIMKAQHLGMFYWLSFFALLVMAVMMLVATPKLKQMQKAGWNLLFYTVIINALFAVFRLFSDVGGTFSGFFGGAVGVVLGSYLLFQVRDHFTGKNAAHETPASPHRDAPHDSGKAA